MSQESRRPRRPTPKAARFFEEAEGGLDPAAVTEAADRAATLLVRGARSSEDAAVGDRLLALADTEGIEAIAELWSGSPADSLAGCLWRLYLLRSWVHAAPQRVAEEFEAGRGGAHVARVVAGVADPPTPDGLRAMVDDVLRGIAERDFADVLLACGGLRPGGRDRPGRAERPQRRGRPPHARRRRAARGRRARRAGPPSGLRAARPTRARRRGSGLCPGWRALDSS